MVPRRRFLTENHATSTIIDLRILQVNFEIRTTLLIRSKIALYLLRSTYFSVEVEAQIPLRLREGDMITMGTTELMVHVTDLEDLENFPPEETI